MFVHTTVKTCQSSQYTHIFPSVAPSTVAFASSSNVGSCSGAKIVVESAGSDSGNALSRVVINGLVIDANQRGMLLVLLDFKSKILKFRGLFDIKSSSQARDRLATKLNSVEENDIVIMCVNGDVGDASETSTAYASIWEALRPLIRSQDASLILKFKSKNSYAFIGGKKMMQTYAFDGRSSGNGGITLIKYIGCNATLSTRNLGATEVDMKPDFISQKKIDLAKSVSEGAIHCNSASHFWTSVNEADTTFTISFDSFKSVGAMRFLFSTMPSAYALLLKGESNRWELECYDMKSFTCIKRQRQKLFLNH